jgi:predicted Na+-dependent transporter
MKWDGKLHKSNFLNRLVLREPDMLKLILTVVQILVLIVVPLGAFLLGLATGRPYLRLLLARPGVLLRFFLATFVVMPTMAIGLAWLRPIPAVWAGLALISMTPPAAGLSEKVVKIGGDEKIGLAWQALAVVLCVFTIPLTLLLAERIRGLSVELGIAEVLKKILILYLVPQLAGFLVRHLWPTAGDSLGKILKHVSTFAGLLLVLLVLIMAVPLLFSQHIVNILIVVGFVACAILISHLLGGPPPELRPTLAGALATRWIAPALVLAQINHSTREIAPVLITYVFAGVLLMMVYGRLVKRAPT